MGIRIGIGSLKIGSSSIPYWTQQRINDNCLFFASDPTSILNKVVATQLPNQVTGSSDYLTITGSGLNARYRTPDSDTYRTADSDYVFWKSDASESTCDGNRLIAYDFPRILVKYLDVSPYTIQWIAILKVGVTVTNGMRDAFHLSKWWDNTLSAYGAIKGNRAIGQSVWTPESVIPWFLTGGVSAVNCIGAYMAKGAGTLAASRDNLASALTTYDLIDGVAPNFNNITGWGFTGTQYLKTGIIPENDQTWSAIVKFSGVTENDGGALFGHCGASPYPQFGIFVEYGGSGNDERFSNGDWIDEGLVPFLSGTAALLGNKGYRDGVAELGTIATKGGVFGTDIYLGARNYSDSADNKFKGNIEYLAIYDVVLTEAQMLAIIAAAG